MKSFETEFLWPQWRWTERLLKRIHPTIHARRDQHGRAVITRSFLGGIFEIETTSERVTPGKQY